MKPPRTGRFAAAWGFAEASLFFIVPDVLLSAIALRHRRAALRASFWATAGALAGGAAMYAWGAVAPDFAWLALDRVPAIHAAMWWQVHDSLAEHGLGALFLGPLTGVPYKLYAVAAGQQALPFAAFLLVSVPARALRFVLIVWLTHAIARRLPEAWGPGVLALCWLAFYTAYFLHMGW